MGETPGAATADVQAAGAVVFRTGREVLLVHRSRYDDWSFPKGKLDPGETHAVAAVREVEEETGVRVRLGVPLPEHHYPVGTRMKTVQYWVGRAVGDDDVTAYRPNDEIDGVEWVAADKALRLLTYRRDRDLLVDALPLRKRTDPVVVLRHAEARPRKEWRADDRDRPLDEAGRTQARRLALLLEAFAPRRVLTSSSERCVATVTPYAARADLEVETTRRLSEEDATRRRVGSVVAEALERCDERGGGVVLCSHRPVLPWLLDALDVEQVRLAPGELLVAHRREGRVVAVERQRA